jgi:hypothetical protein
VEKNIIAERGERGGLQLTSTGPVIAGSLLLLVACLLLALSFFFFLSALGLLFCSAASLEANEFVGALDDGDGPLVRSDDNIHGSGFAHSSQTVCGTLRHEDTAGSIAG